MSSINAQKLEKGLDQAANYIYKALKPTLLTLLAGVAAGLEAKAAKWFVKKLPAEPTPAATPETAQAAETDSPSNVS